MSKKSTDLAPGRILEWHYFSFEVDNMQPLRPTQYVPSVCQSAYSTDFGRQERRHKRAESLQTLVPAVRLDDIPVDYPISGHNDCSLTPPFAVVCGFSLSPGAIDRRLTMKGRLSHHSGQHTSPLPTDCKIGQGSEGVPPGFAEAFRE